MHNKGQSLVELLVAIGVASVMLPAIITGFVASREGRVQQTERLAATALLREAEEAIRVVREAGWSGIATNGIYHPVVSGTTWALTSGEESINGFTRRVTVEDVLRDAAGSIVESGGTLDPSTKKVTPTVSWNALFPSQVESIGYLTRYINSRYIETTEADFSAGTLTNTIVTNTAGGEITLGAGGKADWCKPNLSIAAVDLPKQGVANAISAVPGHVSAGTGENASGVSYAHVTISDADPPVGSVVGTFDGYKTNDIWTNATVTAIATDNNFKEVVFLDISQSPIESGYFNAPGNGNGNSVFIAGSVGYMTVGNTLYSFDTSSFSGSRPAVDGSGVALAGDGRKVIVVGSYAFVAVDSATQLQIVDVSNPANLTVVGQAQLPGGDGVSLFVNETGTRAYVVTEPLVGSATVFIIDTSTKVGNQPVLGSYDAAGMSPKGIVVVPGNRAIVVGVGGEEYQVLNISSETTPAKCGGLSVDTGINAVASVVEADGDAYSYSITGDGTSELKIIEGGPGGAAGREGTFESAMFNAGTSVAFNRLSFSATTPNQTEVKLQLAGSDPVDGSCTGSTFSYVGPDGTSGSFFTAAAAIPLSDDVTGYENPSQCWRYKVFLTSTDVTQSPVVSDVTLNYSP